MGKIRWIGKILDRLPGQRSARHADRTTAVRDERLRAAVANAPIGMALAALDGHWLHFNEAFRTLLGYSAQELSHLTFVSITHPEDAKKELGLMKKLLAGDAESYRMEKRTIDRAGKYRTIHVNAVVVRNAKSEVEMVLYVADVLQQKAQSGQDSDRFITSMIDQMSAVAVIRIDNNGVIRGWNSGAQRMFGYTSELIVGKNRRILYRDPDTWADRPESHLTTASTQGRYEMNDWRVRNDGAEIWVRSTITSYAPDGVVKGYVEVVAPAEETTGIDQQVMAQLRAEVDREKRAKENLDEEIKQIRASLEHAKHDSETLERALRKEMDKRIDAERGRDAAELAAANWSLIHALPLSEPVVPELIVPRSEPDPLPRFVPEVVTEPMAAEPPNVFTAELVPSNEAPALPAVIDTTPNWKELDGDLLLDLLLVFGEEKRSGVFIATDGQRERAIFFTRGAITASASDDPEMFLAERLVNDGSISVAQRHKALELVGQTQVALGRVLLIMHAITPQKLMTALRQKIEDEVSAMCAWQRLQWAFVPRDASPPKFVPLNVQVKSLLQRRQIHSTSVIAAKDARTYHKFACKLAEKIDPERRMAFENARSARAAGLAPCSKCCGKEKKKVAAPVKAKSKSKAKRPIARA